MRGSLPEPACLVDARALRGDLLLGALAARVDDTSAHRYRGRGSSAGLSDAVAPSRSRASSRGSKGLVAIDQRRNERRSRHLRCRPQMGWHRLGFRERLQPGSTWQHSCAPSRRHQRSDLRERSRDSGSGSRRPDLHARGRQRIIAHGLASRASQNYSEG